MSRLVLLLALVSAAGFLPPLQAQEDFLTAGEVTSLRDTQEPAKRMLLYLDFAERRINAVKENLAAKKADAGREVQKSLKEYYSILEAFETTVQDSRDKRAMTEKTVKQAERRTAEFLQYLQSLESETSPSREDYRYTLEEAIAMTEEELAEVKKGAFPELRERRPPSDLPAAPPPASRDKQKPEEGPPRKKRPTL